MSFTAEVSKLTAHFSRVTNHPEIVYQGKRAEHAAIDVLVKPFLNMMGYSVFDLTEVAPEYPVKPGGGQNSKVDLAIMQDGKPAILIECKSYTDRELKQKDIRQLSEYFGHVDTAHFGILTNGITYRFFTDREKRHVMDSTPFLEFDFFGDTTQKVSQLKSFTKANFNQTVAEKEAVRRNEVLLSEDEIRKCRKFIRKECHMESCERKSTLYVGQIR